jgi:hypothetical protein
MALVVERYAIVVRVYGVKLESHRRGIYEFWPPIGLQRLAASQSRVLTGAFERGTPAIEAHEIVNTAVSAGVEPINNGGYGIKLRK